MVVRGDPCRCREHACRNLTAEPKWFMCRPCAQGNHGGPCAHFVQYSRFQPDACHDCGYDRVDHEGAE